MADRIHVVTGIIVRGGRVLLTQRGPTQFYPWMWESPGGKVEPGESEQTALARELLEEIGIGIWIRSHLTTLDLDPGGPVVVNRPLRVSLYDVSIGDQYPRALQAAGMGWFTATDLLALDLCLRTTRAALSSRRGSSGRLTMSNRGVFGRKSCS